MERTWEDFARAVNDSDGTLLAKIISPNPPIEDPGRLYEFRNWTSTYNLQTDLRYKLQYNASISPPLNKAEAGAWLDVFSAFYDFAGKLLATEEAQNAGPVREMDWTAVYESWKEVMNAVYRGFSGNAFQAWTLPVLYEVGKYLRVFAMRADASHAVMQRDSGLDFGALENGDVAIGASKNEKLEDAARQINRLFALCLGDRSPLEDTRKWGLYYTANLLFKTYFKLNSIPLSKNILRSLKASAADAPSLTQFPRSHQVTFKYYSGVLAFLEEDYATAEEFLLSAYAQCSRKATRNVEMILMYLIPTKLLTSHRLPTAALLRQYPGLERLFAPLCSAIKRADLRAFQAGLDAGEAEFVKRRVYLTLERGRDILLRNLFRKVFIAGGFDASKQGNEDATVRRTRVPIDEFAAALRLAGAEDVDAEEVECLLANAIYKNFMKGYISRQHGMVVLGKAGAFPGTGV